MGIMCHAFHEFAEKSSKIVPSGAPLFNYLQEILDFPLAISTSICHSTATIYSGLHLFIGITGLPSSGEFSLISFGTKPPVRSKVHSLPNASQMVWTPVSL